MSDYEYDYDDAPGVPHVNIGAELHLNMPELDLDAPVGGQKLADVICREALRKLAKGPEWDSLKDRVRAITDEEIRNHVTDAIRDALNGEIRRTNMYGEPQGEPTTLRALIGQEATKALGKDSGGYPHRETVLQKLIREQVEAALKAELAEAIKEERAKVVAAVREQAGQLIAEAVTKGVGG